MNRRLWFAVLLAAALIARSADAYRTRHREIKVVKGKPPVEFTGTIKQILTNTLPYQIIVDGSSNSGVKDAPKGKVAFDVQATCRIESDGGKETGSFADLKTGKRIAVSYIEEVGTHFEAETIRLDPPADTKAAKTDTKKKK